MSHNFGFEEKDRRDFGILINNKANKHMHKYDGTVCGKFTILPDDIIDVIISHCGLKTLITLGEVNKHFVKRTKPFQRAFIRGHANVYFSVDSSIMHKCLLIHNIVKSCEQDKAPAQMVKQQWEFRPNKYTKAVEADYIRASDLANGRFGSVEKMLWNYKRERDLLSMIVVFLHLLFRNIY